MIRPVSDEHVVDDLIMTVKYVNDGRIAALLAHNSLLVFDAQLNVLSRTSCIDSSIL